MDEDLKCLNERVDMLINLVRVGLLEGKTQVDMLINLVRVGLLEGKTQREQIRLLSKTGLKPREISQLIDTSANTVRVELVAIRKKKVKVTKKRK